MNDSLEFIDKEIVSYKHLVTFSNNDQKKYYEKCILFLQQIKTELEAWYVVQDKVKIKSGEILDHVLRIKKGALDHDEYRKLKKVGFK